MDSARNMFDDVLVEAIMLSWSVGELNVYRRQIRVDEVNLDVNTRNEQDELWIYQVRGSAQVFAFREDTTVTLPSGKHRWVCTRWVDSPTLQRHASRPALDDEYPPPAATTWGMIKWLYR